VPEISAVGQGFEVALNWSMTNSEDLISYNLYKRAQSSGTFTKLATLKGVQFTDIMVTAGLKYFYKVEAVDAFGNKSMSAEISAVPTHEDNTVPVAVAGSDLETIAGEALSFDGSSSGDNNYIESFSWDFGDGNTAAGSRVSHTYTETGTYTAALSITDSAGNESSDTVTVRVYGTENDSFTIKTIDENGRVIPYVHIVCDEIFGETSDRYTDSRGLYKVIAPSGSYTLYFHTTGFLPASLNIDSAGEREVVLKKQPAIEGKLTSRELDYNEIIALGIDPTLPENRFVFEYTVEVSFDSETGVTKLLTNADGELLKGNYGGGGGSGSSGSGGGGGGGKDEWHFSTPSRSGEDPVPLIAAARVKTTISWLKSFYTVELMIINNADEEFYIDDAIATLNLPDGLSFADTEILGNSKDFGIIKGGESKVISWTIRGDKKGSYNISADFTGTLEPLGETVQIRFLTDESIVIEGGNALEFNVSHELWSPENDVWKMSYTLTNISEKTINDLQFEVIFEYLLNSKEKINDMEIYNSDGSLRVTVDWVDGKPDFENAKWWFNPLLEDIPETILKLKPGEHIEFVIDVEKTF
jgi:PKD repeat protein